MQESRTIQTLEDAKRLLITFDKYRSEIEELEKPVVPEEVPKPEEVEAPVKPEPQAVPKGSILPYIILIISLLAAGGIWYYGKYVLYADFMMYGIGFAAIGFLFFFILFGAHRRAVKKVKTANANIEETYQKMLDEAEAEKEARQAAYEIACRDAADKAAETQKLNEMKIEQANASMDRLEKTYMEKYAKLIPPECCDIESIDRMIELLSNGTVRTIRQATLYARGEKEAARRHPEAGL